MPGFIGDHAGQSERGHIEFQSAKRVVGLGGFTTDAAFIALCNTEVDLRKLKPLKTRSLIKGMAAKR